MDEDFDNDYDPDMPDDGSNANYDGERKAALDAFAEALRGDPRTLRYDLDDWIMLADYAADTDNFYLLTEAVMRGMQAYPDSAELNDRYLLLLNDICRPDEARQAFEAATSRRGASKISRLYKAYYDWADGLTTDILSRSAAYDSIRNILLDGEALHDQEAIEAVRVLADMNLLDMAVRDLQTWSSQTEFAETFWYELAATATEKGLTTIASQAVDLLVERFPYNHRYWAMKARILMMRAVEDPTNISINDEAMTAAEMALAIEPADEEALRLREAIMDLRGRNESAADSFGFFDGDGLSENANALLATAKPQTLASKMTFETLASLLASDTDDSLRTVDAWIDAQYRSMEAEFVPDTEAELFTYARTLYCLDCLGPLDTLLAMAGGRARNSAHAAPLLILRIIRELDMNNLDEARRLLSKASHALAKDDVSVILLQAIVATREGDSVRAKIYYDHYRTLILSDVEGPEVAERIGYTDLYSPHYIDGALAHYLLKNLSR